MLFLPAETCGALPGCCRGTKYNRIRAFADRHGGYVRGGGRAKMPKGVSDEEAALVEPLHSGIGSVQIADIRPGDSAVICGANCRSRHCHRCDQIQAGMAPKMGADKVINAAEADAVSEVVKLTEAGPDAILICTRAGKVLEEAIEMARRGGVIVLVGFAPPTEINPGVFVGKILRLPEHSIPRHGISTCA